MGQGIPKAYRMLKGKPMLTHAIEAFIHHRNIDEVIIVHHADHMQWLQPILAQFPKMRAVQGGDTRQASVCAGLQSLSNTKRVLIHDAARPFVTPALIACMAQTQAVAAIPVIAVTDTIKHADGLMLDRNKLFAAQTPQSFDFKTILKLHQQASDNATDDAALVEAAGIPVEFLEGEISNRKITLEDELNQTPQIAVASGYDVHGFIPHLIGTKTIKICGIDVECELAVEGHSDGDVGLHAITDALLGTFCGGDIGQHFSSYESKWKNADSANFLEHIKHLSDEAKVSIQHIDVTIIAQMPQISPHRETMRKRIADLLSLTISQVSVKATTTDYLGFIGRKEGLAAHAIITVLK